MASDRSNIHNIQDIRPKRRQLIFFDRAVAKARPRVMGKVTYTPAATKQFERRIRQQAALQMRGERPITVALRVVISITFAMPKHIARSKKKSLGYVDRPHTGKPDCDNLIKAILDALNGLAWRDDAQVFDVHCTKRYGTMDVIKVDIEPDMWITREDQKEKAE